MKKIFALVLSLCMVLSTFVAVSAQEMVYNEGIYNEGTPYSDVSASASEDFEDGVGVLLNGNTAALSVTADTVGDRNVAKVECLESGDAYTKVIVIPFTDAAGNKVDLYGAASMGEDLTIDWSIDVMMPDTTVANPNLNLRDGSNPPSGQSVGLKANMANDMVNGEWKTFSGSSKVSDLAWAGTDATYTNIALRMNFSALGTVYVDNMTATVAGKDYHKLVIDNPVDSTADITWKTAAVTISDADGIGGRDNVVKAENVADSNNNTVGILISESIGFNKGEVIEYSFDYYTDSACNPDIWIRDHADLSPFKEIAFSGKSGGFWDTLSGSFTIPDDTWTTGKYAIYVRGGASTCYLDNIKVTVKTDVAESDIEEAGWEVEPYWETPDYSIPSTIALAGIPGTASDNNFSFQMSEVASYFADKTGSNNSYTATISITPDTPVAKNGDWKISADLVMNGLVDSNGKTNVWVRCLDNTTNATQSYTVGYVQKTVDVVDGTLHLEFDASELVAGGTSTSSTIAKFGISFDTSGICNYTDLTANTGSYAYNNVVIESTSAKLTLSAAKTANGVNLTVANNNADKYRFAGRLLIAEYTTVDDILQLVQFAEVAAETEIEAADSVVVPASFEKDITEGNTVKVFVWEPASFDAIQDVEAL